ncbi:MAG: helicase RepA family protein [Gemmataceae bacterium]|nr:helicase RepA family protein [Gemmataceae bacterium]
MSRSSYIQHEMAVVGGMLANVPGRSSRISETLRRLKIDDIGHTDLSNIYTAILALHRDGKEPDVDLVILRSPEIDRDTLHRFLFECLEAAGGCVHHSEYIGRVKAESCRRQLRGAIIDAEEELKEGHCDASHLAGKLADTVRKLAREGQLDTYKVVDGPTLLGMQFQQIMWVVNDLLPEGLTILAGPPKLGKSWLVLLVALAIVNGSQALGAYDCTSGEVLYLALEDTSRRMQARLRKIVNRSELSPAGLNFQYHAPVLGAGLENHLRSWMEEHPKTRLIIVDTLAKVRPARKKSDDIYSADYAVIAALKAVADEKQVAIIVVTHTRKMADNDPLAEVSGTMGITGAADTILVLKRDRGQSHAVLHITGRDVDEQELALAWNADTATWLVAGNAREVRQSEPRKEVVEVFRRENRPLKISDLYTHLPDKNRNSLRSLIADMVKDTTLVPVGNGLYLLNNTDEPPFASAEPDILSPDARNETPFTNQQHQQHQQHHHEQHNQQEVGEEVI